MIEMSKFAVRAVSSEPSLSTEAFVHLLPREPLASVKQRAPEMPNMFWPLEHHLFRFPWLTACHHILSLWPAAEASKFEPTLDWHAKKMLTCTTDGQIGLNPRLILAHVAHVQVGKNPIILALELLTAYLAFFHLSRWPVLPEAFGQYLPEKLHTTAALKARLLVLWQDECAAHQPSHVVLHWFAEANAYYAPDVGPVSLEFFADPTDNCVGKTIVFRGGAVEKVRFNLAYSLAMLHEAVLHELAHVIVAERKLKDSDKHGPVWRTHKYSSFPSVCLTIPPQETKDDEDNMRHKRHNSIELQ